MIHVNIQGQHCVLVKNIPIEKTIYIEENKVYITSVVIGIIRKNNLFLYNIKHSWEHRNATAMFITIHTCF